MKRLVMRLSAILIALIALLIFLSLTGAQAQQQPPSYPVGVSLDVLSMRQAVNLRGQWETSLNRPIIRFSASTALTRRLRFQYQLTTRLAITDSVVPSNGLEIGGTEFGSTDQQQGQQDKKPVTIDYASGCDHAIQFTLGVNNTIQPLVMGKWAVATVSATGEQDGKQVSVTEEFKRTFWAVGASFRTAAPYPVEVMCVAGDRYSRIEGSVSAPFARDIWLRLGGGYEHEDFGDLKSRNTWGFVGGGWRF